MGDRCEHCPIKEGFCMGQKQPVYCRHWTPEGIAARLAEAKAVEAQTLDEEATSDEAQPDEASTVTAQKTVKKPCNCGGRATRAEFLRKNRTAKDSVKGDDDSDEMANTHKG